MGYKPVPDFSLSQFSKLNLKRCDDKEAFDAEDKGPEYWAMSIAEEAGEVNGAFKKLMRGFNKRELIKMKEKWARSQEKFMGDQFDEGEMPGDYWFETQWYMQKNKAIMDECADIFIYLDLISQKLNRNLWDAVHQKFNKVSYEMGLDHTYQIKGIKPIKREDETEN